MIIFYADSINEAYKKLDTKEFNEDIRDYLLSNRNCIDKNNVLNHFELDAYDVHIRSNDLITQNSRLAKRFKKIILDEFEQTFNSLTSNISFENDKNEYSENNLKGNTFEENLKELRKRYFLTQEELSEQIGLSSITIRSYEAGRREPSGKNLCKLAIFFKVNPIEFMGISLKDDLKNTTNLECTDSESIIQNNESSDISMWLVPKVNEIKKRREKCNLSKHSLSLKAGLGGSSICRIENQIMKKVHYLRAREIARVLQCDIKEIFYEEGDKSK